MGIEERAQSPLFELRESTLGVFTAALAAQKHVGTSGSENAQFFVADGAGVYIYNQITGHLIDLTADLSSITIVRDVLTTTGVTFAFIVALDSYLLMGGFGEDGQHISRFPRASASHHEWIADAAPLSDAIRWSATQFLASSADQLQGNPALIIFDDSPAVVSSTLYTPDTAFMERLAYEDGVLHVGGRTGSGNDLYYAKINPSTFEVVYAKSIDISTDILAASRMVVAGNRLAFLSGTKIVIAIDLDSHSVLWAKKITSVHSLHDILINAGKLIAVGQRTSSVAGMLSTVFDIETGALEKANSMQSSGNGVLRRILKSGGDIFVAGQQTQTTFGGTDAQIFKTGSFSDSGEAVTLSNLSTTLANFSLAKTTGSWGHQPPSSTDEAVATATWQIADTEFLL